jgi:hypothetical protein
MPRKRKRASVRLLAKECCNFYRTGGRISNVDSGSVTNFNRRKTRADHQIGLRGKSEAFLLRRSGVPKRIDWIAFIIIFWPRYNGGNLGQRAGRGRV